MAIKRIAITGAAGQIAYSLIFQIAKGEIFGSDQKIALHLLERPDMVDHLQGLKMELDDCIFPLLEEVKLGSQPEEMFENVNLAILIGAKPRGAGMERKELLQENAKIFVEQGKALNQTASKNVKVLVIGNPCNTNCLIALHHAPNLNPNQFFAMTRLDQNRAVYQLAKKANVKVKDVSQVSIWGNHSTTQVPDFEHAKIGDKPVETVILDQNWLRSDFFQIVQKRGAEVIASRGKSSAASASQAIIDASLSITHGENWYSMGIYSAKNPYGIDKDLVFSFPCRSKDAQIISDLSISPFLEKMLKITEKELLEERDQIQHLLR